MAKKAKDTKNLQHSRKQGKECKGHTNLKIQEHMTKKGKITKKKEHINVFYPAWFSDPLR